jgi:predicted outer membrane repeat protein
MGRGGLLRVGAPATGDRELRNSSYTSGAVISASKFTLSRVAASNQRRVNK